MEKINAILILEILGKPKEHVKEVLAEIVDKLGKEDSVKLINKNIAEPKKLEEEGLKEELFTSFAEVEIETSLQKLMLIVFGYMPSHVDIITPEEIKIKNSDLNLFINELSKKLHQYDEIVRALMIERDIIAKQIQEGKIKVEKVVNIEGGKRATFKKPKKSKAFLGPENLKNFRGVGKNKSKKKREKKTKS